MKKILFLLIPFLISACQTLPTSTEWLARGDGYFADGKTQQALKAYNKALQLNPDNGKIYAARGAAYFFVGDYAAAQEDFLKVLSINPYEADAYCALGSALAAQGDYPQALEVLNSAEVLAPNKPEIFFSRGGIYYMIGNYEMAVANYTSVLSLRPAADVYNARGAAYLKLGKTDEAQKDFEMANSGKVPAKLNDYSMID